MDLQIKEKITYEKGYLFNAKGNTINHAKISAIGDAEKFVSKDIFCYSEHFTTCRENLHLVSDQLFNKSSAELFYTKESSLRKTLTSNGDGNLS